MNIFKRLFGFRVSAKKTKCTSASEGEEASQSATSNAKFGASFETNGWRCPKCGSSNISGIGGSNDYGVAWSASCNDCGYSESGGVN